VSANVIIEDNSWQCNKYNSSNM